MPVEIGLGLSPVLPDGRPGTPFVPSDLGLRAWYDAELGQPKNVGYVQLDGTSGDYITTPDSTSLSFSNDIEVVMRVYCNDWSAAAIQTLVGKYVTTSNQRSWKVASNTSGQIIVTVSVDGTTTNTATITPSVALPDSTWIWLRARMDLTNGSNSVGTIETAADNGLNGTEPSSWTANGTATATALAGIFDSTAPLEIGSFQNGASERFSGRIGRCIVRSGFAGTTVADFNADQCYGPGYLNEGSLPTSGGSAYVPLRGVSGDYIWTADKAALRVTGDIEIWWYGSLDSWTSAGSKALMAKWSSGVGGYMLAIHNSGLGVPRISWGSSGYKELVSTVAVPYTAGQAGWVGVTLDVDNGAGGHTARFYTHAGGPTTTPAVGTATLLDTRTGAGTTSIDGTAAPLQIGAADLGASGLASGRSHRAIVRDGISGTTVADFNAANATAFGLPSDGYGNGWLIADPKHHGNWTLGLPKIYDRSGNGVAPATFGAGSNQPLWLPWKGASGVFITPSSSNRLNTPSAAAFDVTDLDVWVDITMPDWTPSGETTIAARKDPSDPNQAWRLTVTGSGAVTLRWYPLGTGASLVTRTSAVTLGQCGVVDGQRVAIRVLLDVDNGAGGYTVTMQLRHGGYDGTWVTFDSFTGGATTALPSVNRVLEFGNEGGNGDVIVHRGVLNGSIGGAPVADFVAASCGQAGCTDALGRVWTLGRATSGRKAVVQSPVAASARSVILHGTDDGIDVPAAAVPTMGTTDNAGVVVAGRVWNTPVNFGRFFSSEPVVNTSLSLSVRSTFVTFLGLSDGTNTGHVNAGPTLTSGARFVLAADIAARSASGSSVALNSDAASIASNATVGAIAAPTGGSIGRAFSGGSYQDCEIEAIALRQAVSTAVERGQLTAYYRGGL